jgi:hypothetical protein
MKKKPAKVDQRPDINSQLRLFHDKSGDVSELHLVDDNNVFVASTSGECPYETDAEIARRIRACWNACLGIDTIHLEKGALKRLARSANGQLLALQDAEEDRNEETGAEYADTKSLRLSLSPFKKLL